MPKLKRYLQLTLDVSCFRVARCEKAVGTGGDGDAAVVAGVGIVDNAVTGVSVGIFGCSS